MSVELLCLTFLLKVALNTIALALSPLFFFCKQSVAIFFVLLSLIVLFHGLQCNCFLCIQGQVNF